MRLPHTSLNTMRWRRGVAHGEALARDLPSTDCHFVDGTPLADGVRDAHVEVSVTAGTNSAEEKAAFIAGAAELLADLVGPPARGGVALHELHPESYGCQGVTQFAYHRQN